MNSELSLEHIKDLIIEAYTQVDRGRREQLLTSAERLGQQLVTEYKSKGLKLTADNIARSLEMHRRNQFKRST